MTANTTHGRVRSALGEHLLVLLLVAIAIVAVAATYPALATGTRGTATRVQERVNMPQVVATYLDDQSAPPKSP